MKKFILYTLIAFTLPGCGGTEGRFRLTGEFKNLRQGEFYIYSNDGGTAGVDTITIDGGSFDYETPLRGEATYRLLYPNLSELVIFGASGDIIRVKGDARNLNAVEVEGSKANEDMTAFRLANKDKGLAATRQAAGDFIAQWPESPVSVFLFREYFLGADDVSQEEVEKHYRALCKAQPGNLPLLARRSDVEARKHRLAVGDSLPAFRFEQPGGEVVCDSDFAGRPLLIHFWASWDLPSTVDVFRLRRLRRDHADSLRLMSISLDVDATVRKNIERRDSVSWTSYCDYQSWGGPAARLFGVRSLPYYILSGADGKILATGHSYSKDIKPGLDKLFSQE